MQLFDIAIGRCRAIEGGTVTIGLDSAIVSRLVPGYPWRMSGTSVLRLSQRLCSKRFPLEPGRETFLQREELMRNPIMGLFLTEASIAAEIARMIPLTDQRDRLKENRDDLEDAKRDREAKQRERDNPDHKADDEEIINKLDEAIEENKNTRQDARKDREKQKEKRDRDLDFME